MAEVRRKTTELTAYKQERTSIYALLCGRCDAMRAGQAGENSLTTNAERFAGLDKEVVLTGMMNRVEIWSKEKWIENSSCGNMDDIAEQMSDLGLSI